MFLFVCSLFIVVIVAGLLVAAGGWFVLGLVCISLLVVCFWFVFMFVSFGCGFVFVVFCCAVIWFMWLVFRFDLLLSLFCVICLL